MIYSSHHKLQIIFSNFKLPMDIQFTKNDVYDLYKEGKILKTEYKTPMDELYNSFSPLITKSDNRIINAF